MKEIVIKWLHKPKIIIPATLVAGLVIIALFYGYIGRTPVVNIPTDTNVTDPSLSNSATTSFDLAFPKVGRVANVAVTVGSVVKKGDVLASLDARDALGAVNQAKGALELAKAQYASLDVQYATTKKQQDVLVENAYQTLLSSDLMAVAHKKDFDQSTTAVDASEIPTITGTYTCDKEGSYDITIFPSGVQSGYSFSVTGLEDGSGTVTYYTPQAIGTCGLFIQFPVGYFNNTVDWVIDIPNTKSINYETNISAYNLALATRDQVLKQLEANLGQTESGQANTAQASVDLAEGAYESALAAYQNDLIVAPVDGVVSFVDSHLKVGQSVTANKTVISISTK